MVTFNIVSLLFILAICQTNAINIKYLTFLTGGQQMEQDLKDLLSGGSYEGFQFAGVENYKAVNARISVADAVFTFDKQSDAPTPVAMGKLLQSKFQNKYLAVGDAPSENFKFGVAVPRLYKGIIAAYKDKERLPYNTDYSLIKHIRDQLTLLLHNKIEHDDVPEGGISFALVNKIFHQDMFYDSDSKHTMDFKMVLYSVGSEPVAQELIAKNLDRHVKLQDVTYGIKLTNWTYLNDFETPDPFCKETYLVKFTADESPDTKKLANMVMVLMNKATIGDRNLYTTFTSDASKENDYYMMHLRSQCGLSGTDGSVYMKFWSRAESTVTKGTPIKSVLSVTKQ